MQIHPCRRSVLASLSARCIGGRSGRQGLLTAALQQAEIQQHWKAVLITAQQVAGIDVAMHELKTVQHGEGRQQLAQQQQHLSSSEHELTLQALLLDLAEAGALLPVTQQPETSLLLQERTEAGNLWMHH